jgi:tryptophan synthase alpha subunit
MVGRIENAFAAAKERGEAAFVTFVTAGYPDAKCMYPI